MRLIFAGTPQSAVPILEALADSRHEVAAVLTQPDKPKGRGRKLAPPPVKEFALARKIPVLQPVKVNSTETAGKIASLAPDAAVLAFFGAIIGKRLLAVPKHGWLNVHPSLLPKYRGPSPVPSAILNGETETGVTIIRLDEEMDHGPILLQMNSPIEGNETAGELLMNLAKIGAKMMLQALDLVEKGKTNLTPQEHLSATYTPMFKKEDGAIDWSAGNFHNFVRAMTPWPGAHTRLRVHAKKCDVDLAICKTVVSAEKTSTKVTPGIVIGVFPEGILIEDGKGETLITAVKVAGKKEMPARDFANGYHVQVGDRFF